jgi:uncharacterized protein YndB with AHSA1/START domain
VNAKSSPQSDSLNDCLGQEFVITHEFDAPRSLVFDAWTDPAHLAQWWGPKGFTNPTCNVDVRPGGAIFIVMRAPNGVDYPMGGEFREIDPPHRLVLTTGALDDNRKMMFEFLHDVTFEDRAGKTFLTMKSKVIKSSPGAGKYIGGFETGMTMSLDRLAQSGVLKDQTVVVERTYKASPAEVWKAITDKDALKKWYFDLPEFKAAAGFAFEFSAQGPDAMFCHKCVVTEAVPEKKLSYSWRYEGFVGDSLVTFELFPEGTQTRVKLTHRGVETFPKTNSFKRENFVKGWTGILSTSLRNFLEGTADREIVISRTFEAPRELVWQAMTDPEHVVQWWGPIGFTSTIEEMDLRPGGAWKHLLVGPDGVRYPNSSTFREVKKPERISYGHTGFREGGPSVESVVTWTFEQSEAGKTRVTIHMVFPSAADRDFVEKEFGAIEGGKQTLGRLGAHLVEMAANAG